ncbi:MULTISPECIES: DUF692 domain-containing protein [Photorhabdus]|uniref:DUF692 domain-containing protein n=1 Tax=Photorhabdus TaxID=29487 RepID=UPI000DCD40B8|nr:MULTISPECIES: DUF692 domain-containing protein [Photorhabdus]MCT8342110.1 DUF692 domain-containing protein [Photorhabdus kleinii]RAX01116.1 hypothetical protein CKY03_06460 [Photorhabdus sp. S9-53]RAX01613.1 hypothetical protein CKY05_05700 [Photorhabdus sp. S10-54]RAX05028.1 hypothetical protein CKY04_06605 [Photorhabdus sp. S8-52]
MSKYEKLGIGVNYKSSFSKEIYKNIQHIDVLEVHSEKIFWDKEDTYLEKCCNEVPIIFHGLDMSLGSEESLDSEYINKLKQVVNDKKPKWYSDHLSATRHGDIEVGHLMPIHFSVENACKIIEKIKKIKSQVSDRFIIENITYYYEMPLSDLSEIEFINRIIKGSDCGMLLDINNLYINSINHNYDPKEFLLKLPLDHVVEIHLAGGAYKFDMIIDTHANDIWSEVWELYEFALSKTDVSGVIIERDSNVEDYTTIIDEISIARDIYKRVYGKVI